ncbi:MAG: hypothetical protein Q8O67_31455 [Deltaproteobacteria bacterium]|nr:hypothetical protein [Deltaproteobacteria bacterium]
MAEIKKVAKVDPLEAAEGAVAFLERVSPAIERVDSSSGSIGTAVNHAVDVCAAVIAAAPADHKTREAWLERLWVAYDDDEIPYLESLGDHWGELCASKELASAWADRLSATVKRVWSPDPELRGFFFKGTTNCLSALVAAGRYDDVLSLLELAPHRMWHYQQFGVQALAALGKIDEALHYAESRRSKNDPPGSIARACEEILLKAGRIDEAYQRFAMASNTAGTYVGTFRAVMKKYPHKSEIDVLNDLVATTPGDDGKWFVAAKDAGLFDAAIALASRTPCNPKTLTNAAREHASAQPAFAVNAGLLALHWLAQGFGYDVTSADVVGAYDATVKAAGNVSGPGDFVAEVNQRIRKTVAANTPGAEFMRRSIGQRLGL